jgi:hypothetical protein
LILTEGCGDLNSKFKNKKEKMNILYVVADHSPDFMACGASYFHKGRAYSHSSGDCHHSRFVESYSQMKGFWIKN